MAESKAVLDARRKQVEDTEARLAAAGISGGGGAEIGSSRFEDEQQKRETVFGAEETARVEASGVFEAFGETSAGTQARIIEGLKAGVNPFDVGTGFYNNFQKLQTREGGVTTPTQAPVRLEAPAPTGAFPLVGAQPFVDTTESSLGASVEGEAIQQITDAPQAAVGAQDQQVVDLRGEQAGVAETGTQGFFSKLWKPDVFKRLEEEGRLHAGTMPIGLSGLGGSLPNQIKVSGEALLGIKNSLTNAAITGKLVESGKTLRGGTQAINYATNAKSLALTTSWIKKIGGVPTIMALIGSYPFAGFIKEEALQTLSFGVKSAQDSGNLEGEQAAIDSINEILDPGVWQQIWNKVPVANVVSQLKAFYKAATTKNALDQESLDRRIAEQETGETAFQRERRESDEMARDRELQFREEDTQFFDKQRTENEEREATDRETENERFAVIEEENRQSKLREQELDSEYFRLIREKKYAEAEALLQSRIG